MRVWKILSRISNKMFTILCILKKIYVLKTLYWAAIIVLWRQNIVAAADAFLCVYSKVHDAVDAVAEKCNEACREPAAVRH